MFSRVPEQAVQAHACPCLHRQATLWPYILPLFLLGPVPTGELNSAEAVSTPSILAPSYNARTLDVVSAVLLLIVVLPLMGLCAIVVLATSRGPLLFRHPRIGRDGVVFDCLKFRTMVADADRSIDDVLSKSPQRQDQWKALHKLVGDPRVTPVGQFLRRYCLDELPQLFNVLAGQMSMVGPRPIVAAEVERYGADFDVYCSVKPGLTGPWQISGRHSYPIPSGSCSTRLCAFPDAFGWTC